MVKCISEFLSKNWFLILGVVVIIFLALMLGILITDIFITTKLKDQNEIRAGDQWIPIGSQVKWSNSRGTLFTGTLKDVISRCGTPHYQIEVGYKRIETDAQIQLVKPKKKLPVPELH